MLRLWFPRRAATVVVAVPLLLGAAVSARAQDGQLPTGDPVTGPKTNRDNPRPNTSTPPRRTTADILTPVPESPSDPAPPGTRGVQIPRPGTPAATGQPGAGAAATVPGRPQVGQASRVQVIEGVVTAIHAPDADARAGGTLVRLVIDPDQHWHAFATTGPQNLEPGGRASNLSPRSESDTAGDRVAPAPAAAPTTTPAPTPRGNPAAPGTLAPPGGAPAPRPGFRSLPQDPVPPPAPPTPVPPADAPAPEPLSPIDPNPAVPVAAPAGQPAAAAAPPNALEVLVTRRTRVSVHARSPEGTDLYGVATASTPDDRPSGTGASPRGLAAPTGPRMTNFTNIRMGSYVSVRYMTIDGVAYALNVNLIELPILGQDAGGRDPRLEPAGAGAAAGGAAGTDRSAPAATGPRNERELDREVLERPSDDGRRNPRDPTAPTIPNTPSGPTGPG